MKTDKLKHRGKCGTTHLNINTSQRCVKRRMSFKNAAQMTV